MSETNHTPTVSQKILFIQDVEKMIGLHRLTLRRWWIQGKFPTPVKLNSLLAWRVETISQWIDQHMH